MENISIILPKSCPHKQFYWNRRNTPERRLPIKPVLEFERTRVFNKNTNVRVNTLIFDDYLSCSYLNITPYQFAKLYCVTRYTNITVLLHINNNLSKLFLDSILVNESDYLIYMPL